MAETAPRRTAPPRRPTSGGADAAPTGSGDPAAKLPPGLGPRVRGGGGPSGGGGLGADPLVALDAVSVVYQTRTGFFRSGQVRAVDDVDLAIARGETLALVGESGSGKTTVGRVSLLLQRPTAGRVRFDGRDVTDTPDSGLHWLRRRAQIVFQDPFSTLNPYMRVAELVEEPLVIDGVPAAERHDRLAQALTAVDLVPPGRFAGRYPSAMSGGQRQRVGIARALIRDPDYIVADEPVSMIDASSRIGILDLLRGLQLGRGVAFLSITHDLASARHFADRIAVMRRGAIVETAPAAAIVDHPLHPYTQALLAAVPEPDPANRFRRRAVASLVPAGGAVVHAACPHAADLAARPDLLPLAGASDHFVACHVRPHRPGG